MPETPFYLSWINASRYRGHLLRVCELLLSNLEDGLHGILAFGSLVKGTTEYTSEHQSDIDLLLLASGLPSEPLARLRFGLEILGLECLGVHRIWETPEELGALINAHQAFTFETMRDGQIVYDPHGMLHNCKLKVQELIVQLGVVETEHAWVWPQKVPGSSMNW